MESLSQEVANVSLDISSHADINCQSMLQAVMSSRQALLDKGVIEDWIIYIARNSPKDKTGTYTFDLDSIKELIETCRSYKWIPTPPKTAYDCFAVDGRDTDALMSALWGMVDYIEDIRYHISAQ